MKMRKKIKKKINQDDKKGKKEETLFFRIKWGGMINNLRVFENHTWKPGAWTGDTWWILHWNLWPKPLSKETTHCKSSLTEVIRRNNQFCKNGNMQTPVQNNTPYFLCCDLYNVRSFLIFFFKIFSYCFKNL